MLLSALLMSKLTVDAELDLVETIGLKWGMSVYSGWLSAATILNTAVVLKNTGIADGWNERFWSILMLWVATAIYIGNAWLDSDPVYAAIYIWALMGIKAQNEDSLVEAHLTIIVIIMTIYVAALPTVAALLEE